MSKGRVEITVGRIVKIVITGSAAVIVAFLIGLYFGIISF